MMKKRRLLAPGAASTVPLPPRIAVLLPIIDERLVRLDSQQRRARSTRHRCSELLLLVIMIELEQQGPRFRAEEITVLVGQQERPRLTELTL